MLNQYLINTFTNETKVIFKQQIAPQVYHIKLFGPCIPTLKYQVGQHLHVLVNPRSNGSIIDAATNRSYSIWGHDQEKGALDMAICTFSGGRGAKWIHSLETGDKVYFTGPTGKFTLWQEAEFHVFIGDISSLSHFYQMRRQIKPPGSYLGIIYGEDKDDFFRDLDGIFYFQFLEKSSNYLQIIKEELDTLILTKLSSTVFYLGGDGKACVQLNHFLKQKYGLKKTHLKLKPFWMEGKRGL